MHRVDQVVGLELVTGNGDVLAPTAAIGVAAEAGLPTAFAGVTARPDGQTAALLGLDDPLTAVGPATGANPAGQATAPPASRRSPTTSLRFLQSPTTSPLF